MRRIYFIDTKSLRFKNFIIDKIEDNYKESVRNREICETVLEEQTTTALQHS